MAHTSECCLLVWAFWAAFRLKDEDSPCWTGGLLGLAFSLAFFGRPLTALTIGGPALAIGLGAMARRRAGAALAWFAVPSVTLAAAFLAVNALQNGSPLQVSYVAAAEYAASNDMRFIPGSPGDDPVGIPVLNGVSAAAQFGVHALGWTRLLLAMWGWPMIALLGDRRPVEVAGDPGRGWPLWRASPWGI